MKDSKIYWTLPIIFILLLIFGYSLSKNSLTKGQVIKQFFAHSIAQSLAQNNFSILETQLPCKTPNSLQNTRLWVEEPPLFHLGGALFQKTSILNHPSAYPIFLCLLIALFVFLTLQKLNIERQSSSLASTNNLSFFLILTTPVFLRYLTQYLPDLMALLLLLIGVFFLLKNYFWSALFFFTLSVTSKALTIFAIAPLLGFYFWQKNSTLARKATRLTINDLIRWTLYTSFTLLPFFVWLYLLKTKNIPNPFFSESSSAQLRHTGGWDMLLSTTYYSRIWDWVVRVGVGLPLFFGYVWQALHIKKNWHSWTSNQKYFFIWSLGLIPYWLVVRSGNFIHDYYFLPFFIPMAYIGSLTLVRVKKPALKWLLIVASIGIGVENAFKQKSQFPISEQKTKFCSAETNWWK